MPIGRGIMQTGRLNIAKTTTTVVNVLPASPQSCGVTVNFQARVVNNSGTTFPTGTVRLIDENGAIVGTQTLSPEFPPGTSYSPNMPILMDTGNHSYHIEYDGVPNVFQSSVSPEFPYSGSFSSTTITFNDLSGSPTFCASQALFISLTITSNSGTATPTGDVAFKLYSDNITSINLPTGTLSPGFTGSAVTAIFMPAFSTDLFLSPAGTFYIQALYLGDSCCAPNATTPGIQTNTDITTVSNITTTTIMDPGSTFSITSPVAIGGHINRAITPLQDITIGSVAVTATKGPTTINLGYTALASGGFWVVNVPGNTFPSTGSWNVIGNYTSDGYCYLGSSSSPMVYTVT